MRPSTSSRPGETLGAIARKYGVKQGDIAVANNITDPRKIQPGQELVIPGAYGSSRPSRARAPGRLGGRRPSRPPAADQDLDAGLKPPSAAEVPVVKIEDPRQPRSRRTLEERPMASDRPADTLSPRSIANPVAVIVVCAVGLTFLGLTILFSASVSLKQDPYFYLNKQVVGVVAAAFLCFVASRINLDYARRASVWIAVIALLLLVLVLVPHWACP
jgi:LysM repeat protein